MIGWMTEAILLLFLFGAVVFLAAISYDYYVIGPERADNALLLCQERGFESYLDYVEKLFDEKPHGLRCANPRTDYDVTVRTEGSEKPYREGYL